MASSTANLERATEIVQQATELDGQGKYAEACQQYLNALDYFMLSLKYNTNDKSRSLIRVKISEYLSRAEALKKHLARATEPVASQGPGSVDTGETDSDTQKLRSSLSSTVLDSKPNVKWDDIAGLEGAKQSLKEAVIIPMKFPQLFTGPRTPWKGILLYGPPGTGKSHLAKAVATEANSTFFSASSSDLVSRYQGDSERLVKQLFELARESKPSVIFIDEIDSLAGTRNDSETDGTRRIKTELLVQMDGVGRDDAGVLVLAATNIPWQLDPAIKRRFQKRIYIPLPGPEARKEMFKIHVGSATCQLTNRDYRTLAEKTNGYSGSDIAVVVRDALMQPIRKVISATHFKRVTLKSANEEREVPELVETGTVKWTPCSPGDPDGVEKTWSEVDSDELVEPPLKMADFLRSLDAVRPTVTDDDIRKHEEWTRQFGHDGS